MSQIGRCLCTIFVVCATLLAGCSEPEKEMAYALQLSSTGLGFGAEGGALEIVVTPHPTDMSWRLDTTSTSDWISCSVEGGEIVVVVEANRATVSRTTTFDVASPQDLFTPIVITISQEAAPERELEVDAPESYLFDSAASSYTFGVRSNGEWSITADAAWVSVVAEPWAQRATIAVEANGGAERRAVVTIEAGDKVRQIALTQDVYANNPYYRLVGSWEITASKWFYSPNGSLNSLDYAPNPTDYYLIFDLEEVEYGKSYKMRNFLYPGTELEVRYDAATQGLVIPFGWTVLSYDVFFYVTLVSSTQFSYASLEVDALPNSDATALTLDLPTVDGFNYVGFGLWTYDENGYKIAVGSNYRPTMFPMGDVKFVKKSE